MRWRIGRRRQGRGPGAPAAHLFGHRSVTLPRRPAAGSDPGVSVLCCTLLWLHQTYQVLRRYIHPSAYPLFSSTLHAQWAPTLTFAGRAFCLCTLTQFSSVVNFPPSSVSCLETHVFLKPKLLCLYSVLACFSFPFGPRGGRKRQREVLGWASSQTKTVTGAQNEV